MKPVLHLWKSIRDILANGKTSGRVLGLRQVTNIVTYMYVRWCSSYLFVASNSLEAHFHTSLKVGVGVEQLLLASKTTLRKPSSSVCNGDSATSYHRKSRQIFIMCCH